MDHTKGELELGDIYPWELWIEAKEGNVHIADVHGNKAARIANAERLALCWNTHDALLEACKAWKLAVKGSGLFTKDLGAEILVDVAIKETIAAIAQAEPQPVEPDNRTQLTKLNDLFKRVDS